MISEPTVKDTNGVDYSSTAGVKDLQAIYGLFWVFYFTPHIVLCLSLLAPLLNNLRTSIRVHTVAVMILHVYLTK